MTYPITNWVDAPPGGTSPTPINAAAMLRIEQAIAAALNVPVQKFVAGVDYSAPGPRVPSSRPNGFCTLLPIPIQGSHTFTGMRVEVVTAGQAGSVIRLGVYADSGGQPGALVVDAGTVPADSVGIKTVTGLSVPLSNGWFYLAATVQAAATTQPVMRVIVGTVPGAPIAINVGTLANGAGWAVGLLGQGAYPLSVANPAAADTAVGVTLIG